MTKANNSASFMAATSLRSNVVTATKATTPVTAKKKGPTKTERLRGNLTKANGAAAKRLASNPSFDALALALVNATKQGDGAARTLALSMNATYKEQMAAFHCHWSDFTLANCRTDNEKAILAGINEKRKSVQALALEKGLANIDKPWSDMKKVAQELHLGGAPREKKATPLDRRQRDTLRTLYKAGMKEQRPTEEECNLNEAIGKLLVAYFKIDLSTLG